MTEAEWPRGREQAAATHQERGTGSSGRRRVGRSRGGGGETGAVARKSNGRGSRPPPACVPVPERLPASPPAIDGHTDDAQQRQRCRLGDCG
jgi:hypothetical protein